MYIPTHSHIHIKKRASAPRPSEKSMRWTDHSHKTGRNLRNQVQYLVMEFWPLYNALARGGDMPGRSDITAENELEMVSESWAQDSFAGEVVAIRR